MTQRDPSTLPTHRPDGPGPAPQAPAGPGPSGTTRPWTPALLCFPGLLAVYLLAVCTPFGQRAENALFDLGESDRRRAWIYPLSGSAYGSTPLPPLEWSHVSTLIAGLGVIAVVTVVRRCWWQGCAAVGTVVVTIGGKGVLKTVLPRPDLVNARESLIEGSFPSGHAAIPAALTLAVVLVASPRIRPYVTAIGVLWLACIAAAVQALGHHRPSDVLGSTLLACVCYILAVRLLPTAAAPGIVRSPRALPPVALTLSAAVALAAGARSDSLVLSLVDAAAAFVCAALLWYVATQGPVPAPRRAHPR